MTYMHYNNGNVTYNSLKKSGYTVVSGERMNEVKMEMQTGKYVCKASEFAEAFREPEINGYFIDPNN